MNNLVLDVDTGEDDALAILLAVSQGLPLRYVVTSYGNASIESTTKNTADLLEYVGAYDVVVVRGSDAPLSLHPHTDGVISAGDFVGKNGLCDIELPSHEKVTVITPDLFTESLISLLDEIKPVIYIVTGPCTNLARVLTALGERANEVFEDIFVMGGAFTEAGNTGPIDPATGKSFAEFNFYCDAEAAASVFSNSVKVKLVTWDETSKLTVSPDERKALTSESTVGKFVLQLMDYFFNCYGLENARDFELNDPITVAAAMGLGSFENKRFEILLSGEQYGRTVQDPSGSKSALYFSPVGDICDQVLNRLGIVKKLHPNAEDQNFTT